MLKHGNQVLGLVLGLENQVLNIGLGLVTLVLVLMLGTEPLQRRNKLRFFSHLLCALYLMIQVRFR